ncbi:MAG: HNH endonuclease [Deltaproteobacteria bacterium]|jgi:hypothetical protein|nr:HNH endonuclease [Deltaproteobacteria bacterium]
MPSDSQGREAGKAFSFTEEQISFIKDNRYNMSYNKLSISFNSTFNTNLNEITIKYYIYKYNICKKYNQITTEQREFIKLLIEENKEIDYIRELFNKKYDKKYNLKNFKRICSRSKLIDIKRKIYPVGSIVQIGDNDNYLYEKTNTKKWVKKQCIEWEKYNEKLDKNHTIIFKDGNVYNFNINNLLLIPMSEFHMIRCNHLLHKWRDEEELELVLSLARLKLKIAERSRDRRGCPRPRP